MQQLREDVQSYTEYCAGRYGLTKADVIRVLAEVIIELKFEEADEETTG